MRDCVSTSMAEGTKVDAVFVCVELLGMTAAAKSCEMRSLRPGELCFLSGGEVSSIFFKEDC